jgi:hypothetical protein
LSKLAERAKQFGIFFDHWTKPKIEDADMEPYYSATDEYGDIDDLRATVRGFTTGLYKRNHAWRPDAGEFKTQLAIECRNRKASEYKPNLTKLEDPVKREENRAESVARLMQRFRPINVEKEQKQSLDGSIINAINGDELALDKLRAENSQIKLSEYSLGLCGIKK